MLRNRSSRTIRRLLRCFHGWSSSRPTGEREYELDIMELESRVLYDAAPIDIAAFEAYDAPQADGDFSVLMDLAEKLAAADSNQTSDEFSNWWNSHKLSESQETLLSKLTASDLDLSQIQQTLDSFHPESTFDSLEQLLAEYNSDESSLLDQSPLPSPISETNELLLVDRSVQNYQQLVDDFLKQQDTDRILSVIYLDDSEDGVAQISQALSAFNNLSAVHIVSHGENGQLQLGNLTLSQDNVGDYSSAFEGWGASLTENADLLFYGCDLAGSENGLSLIDSLAEMTGADVAASDDLTGHASLGGDWDLETHIGSIESGLAFSIDARAAWESVLATYTVNSSADDGTPGTLRWAIQQSNSTIGIADTIEFNLGPGVKKISTNSQMTAITDAVLIDGWSKADFAGTPLIEIKEGPAGGHGLIINADNVEVRGLMINKFSGDGIVVNGDNNLIRGNIIGLDGTASFVGNDGSGIRVTGANNTIGGTGVNDWNVIADSGAHGIFIDGELADGNTIIGNLIGLNVAGNVAIGNGGDGIHIAAGDLNTIGGNTAAARNVISGNTSDGIQLSNGASLNTIIGNYIGTDKDGTTDLGNADDGIYIFESDTNTIGGSGSGEGNVISGNNDDGVSIFGSNSFDNVVAGNYIGLTADGNAALGNAYNGILIEDAASNTIGGVLDEETNVIAGNSGAGILLAGSNATNNQIYNNYIGVLADGVTAAGNTNHGILIANSAEAAVGNPSQNIIGGVLAGQSNLIANNTGDGVSVQVGTKNSIRGNRFVNNTGLAIDLNDDGLSGNDLGDGDGGANQTQNFADLSTAFTNFSDLRVSGSLDAGVATADYDLDFHWTAADDVSGHGEAENYIGSVQVTTDGAGVANFDVALTGNVPVGARLTAIATDQQGNTSEFSANINVAEGLNIDLPAPQFNWDVGDGITLVDPAATVNDPNSVPWNTGNLTVQWTANGTAFDQLSIYAPGTVGNLGIQFGTTLRYHTGGGPVAFGTIDSNGSNGSQLRITFNANATTQMIEILLRSIQFDNTQGPPPDTLKTIEFLLTDGNGETSNTETEQVRVGPANDPPSVTVANQTITYTEGNSPLAIHSALTVVDSDSPTLSGATVTITSNFAVGEDELRWDNAVAVARGITVSYDSATGVMTLSGNRPDTDYQAVLRTVKYENISDDPSTLDRVITFAVDDGFDIGTDSRTVKIVAANDAPVIDLDASDSVGSGLDYETTFIAGGTAVNVTDVDAVLFDVDDLTIEDLTVTITAPSFVSGQDELLYDTTTATSMGLMSHGYNSTTGVLSFIGTASVNDYQTLLRSVKYNNTSFNPDASNERVIEFVANDASDTSLTATSEVYISKSLGLLLSTDGTVIPGTGTPGLSGWDDEDIIKLGDPNLKLEPSGDSDGTMSLFADMSAFWTKQTNSLHFVSRDMTIGGGARTVDLVYGDILFSIKSPAIISGLSVGSEDIVRYRQSDSTFEVVAVNATGDFRGVSAMTLVEQDTTVGDVNLKAGSFLVVKSSTGGEKNDIFYFRPTGLGTGLAAGSWDKLIEGDEIGLDEAIQGLDLVESDTNMGGTTLQSGWLLLSVENPDASIGDIGPSISIQPQDILYLDMTSTTLGSPNASGQAVRLLDGYDPVTPDNKVYLDTDPEGISGISLHLTESSPYVPPTSSNSPPTDIRPNSFAVNENADTTGGFNLGTLTATDPDPSESFTFTILLGGNGLLFSIGGSGDQLLIDDGVLDFETKNVYAVNVRVTDSAGNSYDEWLSVNVTDVAATIDAGQSFNVGELAGNGTPVGTLVTSGDAATTFNISGGNTGSAFAIDNSGQITINDASAIDYESGTSLSLTVEVGDGTTTTSETVVINVSDSNVTIDSGQSFNVGELDGDGTIVGMLTASGDAASTFNIAGGNNGSAFAIDNSGQITVNNASAIDFESGSSFSLTVEVSDGTTTTSETVVINVTDLNVTIDAAQSFNVSEAATNGTAVGTLATSGDASSTFNITAGNTGGAFAIDNSGQITINDASAIDYEGSTSFSLTVEVSDGTTTTSESVVVNVLDADVTIDAGQSFNVNELTSDGTVLGTLTVSGDPATSFNIIGGNTGNAFAIDNSGQITVNDASAIDFETTSSYTLTVEVSDGSTTTSETVVINITDVAATINAGQTFNVGELAGNGSPVGTLTTSGDAASTFNITGGNIGSAFAIDNSGQITINDASAIDYESSTGFSLTVEVSDGTTTTSEAVVINVTDSNVTIDPAQSFNVGELDSDGTILGTLTTSGDAGSTFNITGGNTGSAFAIDNSGQITINDASAIDFESSSSFSLTVEVSDGTTTTNETVVINVTDSNVTIDAGQSFNVSEAATNGTAVGTLSNSGDASSTFNITAGNTGNAFAIDNSGQITINDASAIDYESSTSFSLTVEVSDGTTTTSETVLINVLDADVTIDAGQSFNVNELTSDGTVLGTLTVSGDPATTFNIIGGNTGNAFAIDNSGQITVNDASAIDFETTSSYTLTVEVSDGSTTTSETVVINITDVAATIDADQTFNAGELAGNGTPVGTLTTSGDASSIFNITGGNTGNAFAIDNSGQITINDASAIDYESSTSFSLTVEVGDGTTTTNETVVINVTDANVTIDSGQSFNVGELDGDGTILCTLATTGDASLTFNITGGNTGSAFAIDNSGQITINDASAIDYESSSSFSLTVEVSDGTTTTNETVVINVTDSNVTIDAAQSFNVSEAAANGTLVETLATSGDASSTFNITAGNTGNAFAIDNSGQITINDASAIDYESSTSFSLTVEVSDGTTTTSETVVINVLDADVTIDAGQSFNINELTSDGTVLGTLTVSGDPATTFNITGGNTGNAFAIDNSGQITVNDSSAIDFETTTSYTLTVEASDGLTTTSETVVINITDVAATIDAGQSFNVGELAGNGTPVGTLTTSGDAASTFNITGGNIGSAFAIDNSGQITINDASAIDYESSTGFSLTVEVSDGTTTTSETVVINVTDSNVTIDPAQSFNVGELDGDGTILGTLATSGDAFLTFNITGGNTGSAFAIDNSGQITINDASAIDFESSSSFSLTVEVSDGTTTTNEIVVINVSDSNVTIDAAQLFNVSEAAGNGTPVGTLTTSGDASSTFSITAGNTGSAFAIDNSGQITINDASAIDYESSTSFSLTVEVSDGTTTTSETVVINVLDADVTIDAGQSFNINELTTDGTVLGTLTVSGDPATSFNIIGGNTGNAFAIVNSGQITVNDASAIDYETGASYTLTIEVSDGSTTTSETVVINVTDANEAPVIADQSRNVNENAADGTFLGTAVASDPDAGDLLSYTIVAGDPTNIFAIDGAGNITVADGSQLNYEAALIYSLTVQVTDSGLPGLTDTATFTINIGDVNESPIAKNDKFTINSGDKLVVNGATLLVNDSDPENQPVSVTLVDNVAHGNLTLLPDGSFTYIPDNGFDGTDSFTYIVDDGVNSSQTAQVVIEVNELIAVNAPATPADHEDEAIELLPVAPPVTILNESLSEVLVDAIPDKVQANSGLYNIPVITTNPELLQLAGQTDDVEFDLLSLISRTNTIDVLQLANSSVVLTGSTVVSDELLYLANSDLWQELDAMSKDLSFDPLIQQIVVSSIAGFSGALTVGYVLWIIRGGYLMASVLSSLPAWKFVDPLPILDFLDDSEEDKESIQSILETSNAR